jgi:PadR family transcriptional regulator, regulatory protein AphA
MSPRSALPLRLEYVILGLVRRRSIHGYELLQHWNEPNGIGMIWRVKPGTLYAALEKLEQLGHLDSSLIPGESSPPRKEYRITFAGEQAFLAWMKKPVVAARDFRQDFLARLFFWQDTDPALLEALFSQQELICQRWLASLDKQLDASAGFERQVFSFRIYQVQGILKWLKELSAIEYFSS